MWDKRAKIVRVHDGDTLTVILDQGFGDTKELTLRLLGVWAPELGQPGGPETTEFVMRWVNQMADSMATWPWMVTTARTRTDREQQTFGRYVGTVTTLDGTDNLNLAVMGFVAQAGYGGGIGS